MRGVMPELIDRRDVAKLRALQAIQVATASGKTVHMAKLARKLGCSIQTLWRLRRELVEEGDIPDFRAGADVRFYPKYTSDIPARIAVVHEAKRVKGEDYQQGKIGLTEEELDRVLPT